MAGLLVFGIIALRQHTFTITGQMMMAGPFYGTNYFGKVKGDLLSSLTLPRDGLLQVHRVQESNDFVLSHRLATGSNAWSQLLLADWTAQDGYKSSTKFRDFNLRWVRRSKTGYEVFVTGEWIPGGKEKGLILLGPDLSFRAFYLDW